jgi:hypothetical protein
MLLIRVTLLIRTLLFTDFNALKSKVIISKVFINIVGSMLVSTKNDSEYQNCKLYKRKFYITSHSL